MEQPDGVRSLHRAIVLAALIVMFLGIAPAAAQDSASASCPEDFYSPATRHHAGRMLHPQNVYSMPSAQWASGDVYPVNFVPTSMQIDAVHVSREAMVFSVDRNGYVQTSNGLVNLRHDRPYRLESGGGVTILPATGWDALELDLTSLDAIHLDGEGCFHVSVRASQPNPSGGWLRPWEVYRACPGQPLERLFNAGPLGVTDIDAVHVSGDVVEFSTARNRYLPGGGRLWSQNTYRCTPQGTARTCAVSALETGFEGTAFGLRDLNAYSAGSPCDVTATIVEGEPLTLDLGDARVVIPGGALSAGTELTFSFDDAAAADPHPAAPDETIVGGLYTLSFSPAQIARLPFAVRVRIPDSAVTGSFVLGRTVGGFAKDIEDDPGWMLFHSEYDTASGELVVELNAAAASTAVVVIQGAAAESPSGSANRTAIGRGDRRRGEFDRARAAIRPRALARSKATEDTSELLERGWVATCRPTTFPEDIRAICRTDSVALGDMARLVHDSGDVLAGLGFTEARLAIVSRVELERRGLPYAIADPSGRSAASQEYYVVEMSQNLGDALGVYSPNTSMLHVLAFPPEGTSIHELFHAVQFATIRSLWPRDWVIEATAEAVEPLAPDSTAPDGGSFRPRGWRDWADPLNFQGSPVHYQTSEFWLFIDGSLAYLADVFDALGADPEAAFDESNEYARVDSALGGAGEMPLSDSYLGLIEMRDGESDYPHCGGAEGDIVFTDLVECDSERCSLGSQLDFQVAPLSASCRPVAIELTFEPDCTDPETRLEFEGGAEHRFIVDGTTYVAGDTAPATEAFKLWTANVGIDPVSSLAPDVVYVTACPDPVGVTRQRLHAELLLIDVPDGTPYSVDGATMTVDSWEDGSQPSTRRVVRDTTDSENGRIIDDVITEIDPIGNESITVSIGPNQINGAPGSLFENFVAGGAAGATSDLTTRDETGFVGSFEFSATTIVEGGPIAGRRPRAGAGGKYTVEFLVEDAALVTMTWSCSLFAVVAYEFVGPGLQILESYTRYSAGVENPDWSCDPVELTLDTGRYRVEASYRASPSALTGGAETGDFSIDVTPIP